MKYIIKAYNIWEQGPREKQEDSIFPAYQEINDNDRLFILCDGMGGHSAGEVASSTVCQAMSASIFEQCPDAEGEFSDEIFANALAKAYDELDIKDNGAAKKMGTTLTFLKLHNEGCTIAHIGDSRVYHIRPGKNVEDSEILFQTSDHSLVNDLVKVGELTPEEAKHSKQKNIITRAMQPLMERRSRADIYHSHDIKAGDYFMLCSDGILENMEDDNIKYIFSSKAGDDQNKIDMIIKATAHNHDNHSAIIIHVMEVIDPIVINNDEEETSLREEPDLLMGEVSDGEESTCDGSEEENTCSDHDEVTSISETVSTSIARDLMQKRIHIISSAIVAVLLCVGGYFMFTNDDAKEENKKAEGAGVAQKANPLAANKADDNVNSNASPTTTAAPEEEGRPSVDMGDGILWAKENDTIESDGIWRLPTVEEMQKLLSDSYTWTFADSSYTIKGKNGNSITLPVDNLGSSYKLQDAKQFLNLDSENHEIGVPKDGYEQRIRLVCENNADEEIVEEPSKSEGEGTLNGEQDAVQKGNGAGDQDINANGKAEENSAKDETPATTEENTEKQPVERETPITEGSGDVSDANDQ